MIEAMKPISGRQMGIILLLTDQDCQQNVITHRISGSMLAFTDPQAQVDGTRMRKEEGVKPSKVLTEILAQCVEVVTTPVLTQSRALEI